jgi:hypothetical protein
MSAPTLLVKEDLDACLASAGEEWPDVAQALRAHISALEKSLDAARADVADLKRRLSEEQEEVELKQAALNGLAQFKPSGQVAEDVERVREGLLTRKGPITLPDAADDALSRLTAKAHGYEAAVAERDALAKFKAYVHQRLDEAAVPTHPNGPHSAAGCRIGDRMDILVAERDAALSRASGRVKEDVDWVETILNARGASDETKVRFGRLAAKAQGYEAHIRTCNYAHEQQRREEAEEERDAAVADNAEQHRIMTAVLRRIAAMHYEGLGLKEALDADHPGAALLEEHRKALSDLEHMKRQRDHIAALLGVADGGEWQNDWDAPVRKALVRARNEVLEKARKYVGACALEFGAQSIGRKALVNVSGGISALKEPEE